MSFKPIEKLRKVLSLAINGDRDTQWRTDQNPYDGAFRVYAGDTPLVNNMFRATNRMDCDAVVMLHNMAEPLMQSAESLHAIVGELVRKSLDEGKGSLSPALADMVQRAQANLAAVKHAASLPADGPKGKTPIGGGVNFDDPRELLMAAAMGRVTSAIGEETGFKVEQMPHAWLEKIAITPLKPDLPTFILTVAMSSYDSIRVDENGREVKFACSVTVDAALVAIQEEIREFERAKEAESKSRGPARRRAGH